VTRICNIEWPWGLLIDASQGVQTFLLWWLILSYLFFEFNKILNFISKDLNSLFLHFFILLYWGNTSTVAYFSISFDWPAFYDGFRYFLFPYVGRFPEGTNLPVTFTQTLVWQVPWRSLRNVLTTYLCAQSDRNLCLGSRESRKTITLTFVQKILRVQGSTL
jgi:hypothetical protein